MSGAGHSSVLIHNALAMTSADFAAAQQRVLARQQLRAIQAQAHTESQRSKYAFSALAQLPSPLGRLARNGVGTWDKIKGRGGTKPAFRVGQVDAELLDEELLELLKGQVGEALKYFGVRTIRLKEMAISDTS